MRLNLQEDNLASLKNNMETISSMIRDKQTEFSEIEKKMKRAEQLIGESDQRTAKARQVYEEKM